MRITAHNGPGPRGREIIGTDITHNVQVAYDCVLSSMDWGSGMLDMEEMIAIIQLGVTMGWELPDLGGDSADGIELELANQFPDHYEIGEKPMYWYAPHSPHYYNEDGTVRMRGTVTKKEL